jgi:hypothetical protein
VPPESKELLAGIEQRGGVIDLGLIIIEHSVNSSVVSKATVDKNSLFSN